jgi:hypothetical protein
MKREDLKINQKVIVIPRHTNKDRPAPKTSIMYVRELNEGDCAGLSWRKNEKQHIYGIYYDIIHTYKLKGKKK